MSEADIIDYAAPSPVTEGSLVMDLRQLGVTRGDTLIVHCSLSSIGWACGGATALIRALQRAVSPQGCLVMPAHSSDLSDPALWQHPPVPEGWWPIIRESMPAFDRRRTQTRGIGVVPELFRTWPGVSRSRHPELSFCAWGRGKGRITRYPRRGQGFDDALGERSPLGALYAANGKALLIGVGYDRNTSLHLAEYRASFASKKRESCGAPVTIRGRRRWVEYSDIEYETADFPAIGSAFEASGGARTGAIGAAPSRLMAIRDLVDFAASWMERNRS
jgi:Aminoglycoside N3''-acetyltransferase